MKILVNKSNSVLSLFVGTKTSHVWYVRYASTLSMSVRRVLKTHETLRQLGHAGNAV